jgi:hypothetical protein
MKWLSSRACGLLCAAGLVLFLSGCANQGTVSGKVSLNGKPLPGGVVTVIDGDGQSHTGGISKTGTYSVSNIAPGKALVTVVTMGSRPSVKGPEAGPSNSLGEYVPVPAKYMDPQQSGLALDVKAGKQEFDIQMTGEAK